MFQVFIKYFCFICIIICMSTYGLSTLITCENGNKIKNNNINICIWYQKKLKKMKRQSNLCVCWPWIARKTLASNIISYPLKLHFSFCTQFLIIRKVPFNKWLGFAFMSKNSSHYVFVLNRSIIVCFLKCGFVITMMMMSIKHRCTYSFFVATIHLRFINNERTNDYMK